MSDGDWIEVGPAEEVAEGRVRVFRVGDERLAICRVEGDLFAVEDTCTHDDGPLGEGTLEGHAIQCPRHGARFDVRTGAVLRMPAACPIRTFEIRDTDGRIEVRPRD